jgi:hypothetical protein
VDEGGGPGTRQRRGPGGSGGRSGDAGEGAWWNGGLTRGPTTRPVAGAGPR